MDLDCLEDIKALLECTELPLFIVHNIRYRYRARGGREVLMTNIECTVSTVQVSHPTIRKLSYIFFHKMNYLGGNCCSTGGHIRFQMDKESLHVKMKTLFCVFCIILEKIGEMRIF